MEDPFIADVGRNMSAMTPDFIFPRSFTDDYPIAKRAEGMYLYHADGKRYLDAWGQERQTRLWRPYPRRAAVHYRGCGNRLASAADR